MKDVLLPLKGKSTYRGRERLLYKTTKYSNFKFGPAIASRNEHLFEVSELADKGVIRAFEKRYNTTVSKYEAVYEGNL
jgi:hypothetical protein